MCLTLNRVQDPKVAKKNITCYKKGTISGKSFSPRYKSSFVYRFGRIALSRLDINTNSIKEGLHSFASYRDCVRSEGSEGVVKCIIPKGALYYEGDFSGKGYASNLLMVVGIAKKRKR